MPTPIATLIISVYNNTFFLKLVLDSLKFQTDKRFEVIISEDAEHSEMSDFIKNYKSDFKIYHLTQPDLGWQKNRALNRAIEFANCDYLIFIDGDCVLHPRFVEFHLKLSSDNYILGGKRIKLDKISSDWLALSENNIAKFQKYLLKNFFSIKKRGALFIEEAFFINPKSPLFFIPKVRKMSQLKGCNMSFSKKAIYSINGFDEDYIRPAIGEDIDITWRFLKAGYKLKSVRNLAVQYHLYHKENWINQDENIKMMEQRQKENLYICKNGIIKNSDT